MSKVIASEYVSFGHPDKMADQISDALLDEYLKQDKNSLTGIEVLIKDNVVVLGGEVNSKSKINVDNVVRKTVSNIPFSDVHKLGYEDIKVINLIGQQSKEINSGIEHEDGVFGAGDQGFMVGYATNHTPSYLPLGLYIAKTICNYISINLNPLYGPDVKSQVIVEYGDNGSIKLKSILVSTMHTNIDLTTVRINIMNHILNNLVGLDENIYKTYIQNNDDLLLTVNPCGSWNVGGPVADCGVTGRKIVVDQYGGYCNVGGGAFSGKDGTKVDRSAAYMARYLAKNIVASDITNECKVELSYIIGVPHPSSINIETDVNIDTDKLIEFIYDEIDLTPNGIINLFGLREPIYSNTAKYGHFGISEYPWEDTSILSNKIKKLFNK